jgi:sugar phosphate permease
MNRHANGVVESEAAPIFVPHPPGFRARRGLNWAFVGLIYTSFYMCRYNLSIANSAISGEFGFTKGQMGKIITTALLAYACGQILNGLLTDRLGGKRAMLIGAAGTITMNLLFGAAYACTGSVRQGIDQWFPRFMQEVHHLDFQSPRFQFLGFLIPFVASFGSLISGYVSDTIFRGRRPPVGLVFIFWKLQSF